MMERELSPYSADIQSDCAPVIPLLLALKDHASNIHVLRDPTRGGLAAVLNEIVRQSSIGMEIEETEVPVPGAVRAICAAAGIDPFNLACEGRLVAAVERKAAEKILQAWRKTSGGEEAAIIGRVCIEHPGIVAIITETGEKRVLRMPSGELLPRIC
ncbi:MAG: AIR synthase-related protein, partial [Bacillota bacterium]|nr:AIR synthase-related protein [Bacillota bacterium]